MRVRPATVSTWRRRFAAHRLTGLEDRPRGERAQGYLRLPSGEALRGFGHEYQRHGTSTLFAALEVATGLVHAAHYHRRRRREFLAFMNEVVAAYPDRDLHVILDNLSTHKPKRDRWLARHPRVHLHFTPTHAGWLNLVECWFSILSRAAVRGASFPNVAELRAAIDAFIAAHHPAAAPFEWRKVVVYPSRLSIITLTYASKNQSVKSRRADFERGTKPLAP